jgi:hypothetical protein
MKIPIIVLTAVLFSSTSVLAACPQGKITCSQWCAKYGTERPTCMTGHPNSCDKKPLGGATCVGDVPRSGQMSGKSCSQLNGQCVAFCKINPERTGCLPDCNQAVAECMRSGNWNTAQTHLSGLKKQ